MRLRSRMLNRDATEAAAISMPDYDRLRDSLANVGAVVAVAELHGGVCAALCTSDSRTAARWLRDCLDDQRLEVPTADVARDLDELIGATLRMLGDEELRFEPLLPGDDAPLEERVQALALWCHGFLAGLGATAPGLRIAPGSDTAQLDEILRDFGEISRAGVTEEEAAGPDEADFALAEVHEYVRISVQLVYEQLASYRAEAARELN
jgi:uncharacterized protein YgfB (UPF0149 family)